MYRPALSSRFAVSALRSVFTHAFSLGGQNLAALCTAAGENLAAVGSSHSLTETVNLGTVTAAGLIGTLHLVTPPENRMFLCSTAEFRPQQHIVSDHKWPC